MINENNNNVTFYRIYDPKTQKFRYSGNGKTRWQKLGGAKAAMKYMYQNSQLEIQRFDYVLLTDNLLTTNIITTLPELTDFLTKVKHHFVSIKSIETVVAITTINTAISNINSYLTQDDIAV